MSDANSPSDADGGQPTAAVRRERISIIWLIPIVAGALGIWLAYQSYREQGPTITIAFETADGLDAGKTKIKHKGVVIGDVTDIRLDPGGSHAIVSAEMRPQVKPYLTEETTFWVVKPRVGVTGITGLGTIVSGFYIGMRPGTGKPQRAFVGAENPPVGRGDRPGLHIRLETDALHGLAPQSPIFYREIRVGFVQGHQLEKDSGGITLHAFIDQPYKELVREHTRFYDAGGIRASVGLEGVEVDIPPVDSVLLGGVAFETPAGEAGGKPVADGTVFPLYDSHKVLEQARAAGGLHLVLESPRTGSVEAGDQVYYRELPIGVVTGVELSLDSRTIRTELAIHWAYRSLVRSNSKFWNASGISAELGLKGLQLQTESLEALLAGGVALSTPDRPGHTVTSGSVFALEERPKPEWLGWAPLLWRGDPKQAPRAPVQAGGVEGAAEKVEHGVARFFHHKGKSESETRAEHAAHEQHRKHHFLGRLLHHGSREAK